MTDTVRRSVGVKEGAGADVQRLMPVSGWMNFDPFVLWDHFAVSPDAGLPDHPHRGFEIITWVLAGAMRHEDSLGNASTVLPGGAQRVTAGRGITHSEMPQGGVTARGIQLWINLPRRLKGVDPGYQQVDSDEFPRKDIPGGRVITIVGEDSPLELQTQVRYLEVRLEPGASWGEALPAGWRGIVYVVDGTACVRGNELDQGMACLLEDPGPVRVEAREDCVLMACFGRPHGEEIRQYGPFVD